MREVVLLNVVENETADNNREKNDFKYTSIGSHIHA